MMYWHVKEMTKVPLMLSEEMLSTWLQKHT